MKVFSAAFSVSFLQLGEWEKCSSRVQTLVTNPRERKVANSRASEALKAIASTSIALNDAMNRKSSQRLAMTECVVGSLFIGVLLEGRDFAPFRASHRVCSVRLLLML